MQVPLNQVVVQLSSSARVGGDAPVFSVSNAPAGTAGINQVQLSAAARAMAEVSSTGTRPQLAMFVQLVGSLGPGAANNQQLAHMQALAYTFLRQQLMAPATGGNPAP